MSIGKLLIEGKEIIEPNEIANKLNNYFCSVGPSLATKLAKSKNNFMQYMNPPIANSFFCTDISESEIRVELQQITKKNKASMERINCSVLSEAAHVLAKPLQYIFNQSLLCGKVPNLLKMAKVIPIFKKGDNRFPENYRPISLLSIFDKIFEKIVCRRILNFWNKHNVIYKYQFGFRKNHSTTLALIEITDNIYKWLDDQYFVMGLYIDLQKAFDTLNHEILLKKLYNYGIRGNMINWFRDYLTNRKQCTLLGDGIESTAMEITSGVPQGSVLGPILFIIYVNDLVNASPSSKIRLFADDTNIFIYSRDLIDLYSCCNQVLEDVSEWMLANKLSINADKTNYTLFTPSGKVQDINNNLVLNGIPITKAQCVKYLGIYIDKDLKWMDHIKHVYDSVKKYTGIFYKVRYKMPKPCLKNLYYATVYPLIQYGIELYANTNKTYLYDLMILNNKLLRILQFQSNTSCVKELYSSYNTLQIDYLHEYKLLMMMYRYFNDRQSLPEIFQEYFTSNSSIHSHKTRTSSNLHLDLYATNFGKRCLQYRCSKLWNCIPNVIRSITSFNVFKSELKKYYHNIN